jgi:hypothetical protein
MSPSVPSNFRFFSISFQLYVIIQVSNTIFELFFFLKKNKIFIYFVEVGTKKKEEYKEKRVPIVRLCLL